jgi:hypothetical protein
MVDTTVLSEMMFSQPSVWIEASNECCSRMNAAAVSKEVNHVRKE